MIEKELVIRAKRGKKKNLSATQLLEIEQARAEIVTKITRLVHKLAQPYRGRLIYITYEELFQEGMCGVMVAIEKFDGRYENKFTTYAVWWIRQAICRAMKYKNQTLVRRKCEDGLYSKFEAFFEEDIRDEDSEVSPELKLLLIEAMKCLNQRDREIIKLRFYECLTLKALAKRLNLSRERVRQIELRALKRMYKYFEERGMKFFEDC